MTKNIAVISHVMQIIVQNLKEKTVPGYTHLKMLCKRPTIFCLLGLHT